MRGYWYLEVAGAKPDAVIFLPKIHRRPKKLFVVPSPAREASLQGLKGRPL